MVLPDCVSPKKIFTTPFVPYSSNYVLPTRHRNLPAVPTTSFVSGNPCTNLHSSAMRPHTQYRRLLDAARSPTQRRFRSRAASTSVTEPLCSWLQSPGKGAARLVEKTGSTKWPSSEQARGLERASPRYSITVSTENARTARPYPWSRTEVRLPPAQSPFLLLGNPPSTGYSPGLRAHLRTNRAHRTAQALRRNGEGDGTLHTTPTAHEC